MESLNKYIFLVLLFMLSCLSIRAQNSKNTIGAGLNCVRFNRTGEVGLHYSLTMTRRIASTKNELEGRIGIITLLGNRINSPELYDELKSFNHFSYTSDFTFLHNIIKNPSHALRIGLGPSVWFFKEVNQPSVTKVVATDGIIFVTAVASDIIDETTFGFNMIADYKFVSMSRFSLLGRGGYTSLSKVKSSFSAGVLVAYQF